MRVGAIVAGVVAVAALGGVYTGFYTVSPSDRAYVRFLGNITTTQPIQPGSHLKVPYLSTVDILQVSQTTLAIPAFFVNTVDNQRIEIESNITYDIPDDGVAHLLYGVGKSGADEIREAIIPVVQDRISRIMSTKNTNNISLEREVIQNEITKSVEDSLKDLFKVRVLSLQLSKLGYSEAFIASNNNAVLAKNQAVQEENRKKVIQYQGEQRVISAEADAREKVAAANGQAQSLLAMAEANKRSKILEAEGEAQAATLLGKGEASKYQAVIASFGDPEKYIEFQRIMIEGQRWNGSVPSTVISGSGGNLPPLVLSLPQVK